MTKDMTEGKPLKLILSFCMPLIIGNIFQQLYNMVDTIIVGQYIGKDALAAVGATGSINFMVIGFALGICSGFGIPIAQSFGAKDYKKMRKHIANAGYLCLGITVFLTILTVLLTPTVLTWMQTPSDIFQQSYEYIVVIFYGIFATVLYNMLSSILRSLGDSKTPLYFLMLSSIINVVLDLFFIINLNMGVAGAALATVIAQAISGISCLLYIKKKFFILHFEHDEKKFDIKSSKKLLSMGLPMALQFSITAIGSVIVQAAVNTLGSDVVAAITAAIKISIMLTAPLETLGLTMATYGGQNLGAGKVQRIFDGLKQSFFICFGYCIIAFVFVFFVGDYLGLLFINAKEIAIIENISLYLMINAGFYALLGILFILRNTLQGLGYSFLAMFGGVFELVARSIVAFGFVGAFGYSAICFANPLAWLFADILFIAGIIYKGKELKLELKNQTL